MWTRWFYALPLRLRSLLQRRRMDGELDEEISFHLAAQAACHREAGMSEEGADAAARRNFGGLTQRREECVDTRPLRFLEEFVSDIHFAVRSWRRSPGFAFVGILSLALPIGATAAIISALYAILLSPLPFDRPEELGVIWQMKPNERWQRFEVAPGNFMEWKQRSQAFEDMAAINPFAGVTLTGLGEPERMEGARVSANFFDLLGRGARYGRTFVKGEDQAGHDRVAVITESLWRRRFGADIRAVGRAVSFDGAEHTIIGVLPADFPVRAATPDIEVSTRDIEVWRPLALNDVQRSQRDQGMLRVIGRLREGVTFAAAAREMSFISKTLGNLYPATNRGWEVQILPLAEQTVGETSQTIVLAAGGVGCTLLLACVSVAGLLLARATARMTELRTRVALGANGSRVVRQLLTESVTLAAVGGSLGIALAYAALPALRDLGFLDLPRRDEIVMRAPALLLSILTVLITGLVCGTAPVIRISRRLVASRSRHVTGTRQQQALGNALVAAQVAISCVLLVGMGLLLRTVAHLQAVDPGFDPRGLLTLQITLPPQYYPRPIDRVAFFRRVHEAIRQLPGVSDVGSSTSVPFMKRSDQAVIPYFAGSPHAPAGVASANAVMPSYFDAIGIPLQGGRLFTMRDDRQGQPVIIVNQALASAAWPGRNPIGQKLSVDTDSNSNRLWRQVVGVVGDVRPFGLDSPEQPSFYLPQAQFEVGWQVFVVRSRQEPAAVASAIQRAVMTVDGRQPIHNVATMSSMIDRSLRTRKAVLGLLSVLGSLALMVAGIGLYGLLSYQVQQSRKEIGIRSALGASPSRILREVVERGIALTATGVSVGLVAAAICGRALASLLFGVHAVDLQVYVICAATLIAVGIVASAAPSWRALRVSAAEELRRD